VSTPADFNLDRLLGLDVTTCESETLQEAVRWASQNAPGEDRSGREYKPAQQLFEIGNRHRNENATQSAIEAFETALLWSGSELQKATIYNSLASMLCDVGQLERAAELQKDAIDIILNSDPPQLHAAFVVAFNRGNTLRHAGRLEEAEQSLREATQYLPDARRHAKDQADRFEAKLHVELGLIAQAQDRGEEALDWFQRVVTDALNRGDGELYLEAGKGYAASAQKLGRHNDAIRQAAALTDQVLLPTLRHHGANRDRLAELLNITSLQLNSLMSQERTLEAESRFDEVREQTEEYEIDDPHFQAQYSLWRARWCERFHRGAECVAACKAAVEHVRRCTPANPSLEREATKQLLFAYVDDKQNERNIPFIREALGRTANREDPKQYAVLAANLAVALYESGDLSGVELAEQSLEYFLGNLDTHDSDAVQCGRLLSQIYPTLGRAADIEPMLLRIKQKLAAHGGRAADQAVGRVNELLVDWYGRLDIGGRKDPGEQDKLLTLLEENRERAGRLARPGNDLDYARWLCRSDRLDESESMLRRLAGALDENDVDRFVETVVELAQTCERADQPATAARLVVFAANTASRFTRVRYQAPFLAALLHHGEPELVRNLAARMRDTSTSPPPRVWKIHQRVAAAYPPGQAAAAIVEIDRAIQNYSDADRAELLRLNVDRRARFEALIDKALAGGDLLEAWKLADTMARSGATFETLSEDAAGFFGRWVDQAAVICYYALDRKILVVAFRPGTGTARAHMLADAVPVSRAVTALYDQAFDRMLGVIRRLEEVARQFQEGQLSERVYAGLAEQLEEQLDQVLADPTIDRYLAELYQALIEPVEEEFRARSVVAVVAESYLASVPFYALYDAKRRIPLLDRGADLFLLPSLADLRSGPGRRKPDLGRRGLVAVPDAGLVRRKPDGAGEEGPGQSAEVRAVLEFGDCRLLAGADATLRNLAAHLPGASFVHFLSHGATNFLDPENAGIVLAGGERLRGAHLRDLGCDALWMAVLGSCYGANYRQNYAGEYGTSLAHEFIRNGVPFVVGSLWFVGADATEALMGHFYRELDAALKAGPEGCNLAGVFRRALVRTREEFPHFFDWGLFYPLGDFCPRTEQQVRRGTRLEGVTAAGRPAATAAAGEPTRREGSDEAKTDPRLEVLSQELHQLFQTLTWEDARCLFEEAPVTARIRRAVSLMYEILAINPDETAMLGNIAQFGPHLVDPTEALRAARHLVEVDPSFGSLVLLGLVHNRQQRYEEALPVLEAALNLGRDPNAAFRESEAWDLYANLALAKANLGSLQEALDCAETALKLAREESQTKRAIHLRDQILAALDRAHG
jgi:CHAT domain-containing protein/tetratricopeptide (TPR) repeat protein